MLQHLDVNELQKLANTAACRLARDAETNADLKEALFISKQSDNSVRIGECIISYTIFDTEREYEIIHESGMRFSNIVFYETARHMVMLINSGYPLHHQKFRDIVATNDAYRRAKDMASLHQTKKARYEHLGDWFRSSLNDNKLSRDVARMSLLEMRLLEGSYPY